MRYIIAAKLRKLKKGKFHCASGRLNSLLCTVAASSFIKFLATDWLFPDKYGDASSCDSMHFSVTMTQAVGGGGGWGDPGDIPGQGNMKILLQFGSTLKYCTL